MSRDTLELMEISESDAGHYQCSVDAGAGVARVHHHTVLIAQSPVISWCNVSVTVVAGTSGHNV